MIIFFIIRFQIVPRIKYKAIHVKIYLIIDIMEYYDINLINMIQFKQLFINFITNYQYLIYSSSESLIFSIIFLILYEINWLS
jgi:hypothetical protein